MPTGEMFTADVISSAAAEISAAAPVETSTESTESTTESTESTGTANTAAGTEGVTANTVANTAVSTANTVANTAVSTTKEPPKEKWETILENARTKTRAEVKAEYTWAEGIAKEEGENIRELNNLGKTNPLLFLDTIIRRLHNNPALRSQVETYLGRLVTPEQVANGTATTGNEMPQPPTATVFTDKGEPVLTLKQQQDYMQQVLAWQEKQLTAQFQKELTPFKQERDNAATTQQTNDYATKAIATVRTQPGFQENLNEIMAEFEKVGGSKDPTRSEQEKLQWCYLSVVAPKLQAQGRLAAIEDTKKKAEAGSADPSSPKGGQAFDYKKASFLDAIKHEAKIKAKE